LRARRGAGLAAEPRRRRALDPTHAQEGNSIMSSVKAALMRQFGHPRGMLGRLAGLVMATRRSNRQRIKWTVEQLDVQPTDQVLEIGFGPGIGIADAARRASQGRVVGVDVSAVM